jgi:uncharacterized protein YceK
MKALFLAFLVSLISGCATLSGNGTQEVVFNSNQNGLSLWNYKGEHVCDLPCKLSLDGNDLRFYIAKGEGYKSKMITVGIKRNKASYADLTPTSSLVDNLTGASIDLDKYVYVELEKDEQ